MLPTTPSGLRLAAMLIILVSIIPGLIINVKAQNQEKTVWQDFKTDVHHMGDGFAYVLASPTRWKGKDFLKLAGFIGGTILVSFADEPFYDWATRTNNPDRAQNLETLADLLGKPGPAVIGFSVLYTTGLLTKNEQVRDAGILLFSSLGATALFQTASKTITGRARPATGERYYVFKPFNKDPNYHSFPSGHTVSAMTITTVLSQLFKPKSVKIVLLSLGVGTGFSRAYNGAHWLSDIVASAGISYLSVRTAESRYRHKKGTFAGAPPIRKKSNLTLLPMTNGFALRLTFN